MNETIGICDYIAQLDETMSNSTKECSYNEYESEQEDFEEQVFGNMLPSRQTAALNISKHKLIYYTNEPSGEMEDDA